MMKLPSLFKTYFSRKKQNVLFQDAVEGCKELVVFCIPEFERINGGILSIFNLAKYSRMFRKRVIIATLPSVYTYYRNTFFNNDEIIYRFSQIAEVAGSFDSLMVHIPEYSVKNFCNNLSAKEKESLKKCKDLHFNIMTQNIELAPSNADIEQLRSISDKLTQTVAHARCANQDICSSMGIITHFFGTYLDLSGYAKTPFKEKKKLILFSPDKSPYKKEIRDLISKFFPSFKVVTVKHMPFDAYVRLVSKAICVITFGEGFDGYFLQACEMGTPGIAVYNDKFFPDKSWLKLPNIYDSFPAMIETLAGDLQELASNEKLYSDICEVVMKKNKTKDIEKHYINNIKRFYERDYDFYPKAYKDENYI